MNTPRHETRALWAGRIRAQEVSGLLMADYCRQHGLDPKAFYRWRMLLAREIGNPNGPHARAVIADAEPLRFMAVTLPQQRVVARVRLPNGTLISVFDSAALAAIVTELRPC